MAKKIEGGGDNAKGQVFYEAEKETRYILDVPRSFFELCLKEAKSKEEKKEMRQILKNSE